MTTDFDVVFDPSATFTDDDPLAPVHAYIGQMRAQYGQLPAPEPRADLAARFRAEPERAVVVPLRPPHATARTRTRRLRRAMLVAAALAVAVATTGGLAAAGALPDTLQNAVSDILDRVGIDVPHDQASQTPPPIRPAPQPTRSSGAPATAADRNAGAAGTTPVPGTAVPAAAPETTVPPTSTTALPGVPPPLPVEPTLPIDVPLPPLPPLPPIDLPPLPIDVPLPPIDLPPIDLPPLPIDVPPIDVPPIDLPPLLPGL